jgi:dihydroorotase
MQIRNATLADGRQRDIRVVGERIESVAERVETRKRERVVDATGKRLLPGMVDMHVHLRQPGFGHKETWRTGTRSAAAGGVTTVVDQPNTDPPTVDGPAFDRKCGFTDDATVDFGLNGGVTGGWEPDSLFDRPLCALGEVFLADSTGEMGINEALFVEALERASDLPVTVHAEDESLFEAAARERSDADAWSAYRRADAEIAATRRACRLAAERDRRIHVAHASTPESINAAARAGSTCEVTPHHMLLSRRDLSELGTHGRMNPPLRRERHRRKLFERVADGTVDVVATDHAPHTREEKAADIWAAPSGVPGVETALPLLLAQVRRGRLGFDRVRDLTARNPAAILGLSKKGTVTEGSHADLVLVDPGATSEIRATDLHTRCEWTPFEGHEAVFPEWTMCRGRIVYRRETDTFEPLQGENVRRQGGG